MILTSSRLGAVRRSRRARSEWWLAAPAVVSVLILVAVPVAFLLQYSTRTGIAGDFAGVENFTRTAADPYYYRVILTSLAVAFCTAVLCAIASYPVALMVTRASRRVKPVLILLCIFPLLAGTVVRSIGWMAILGYSGPVSKLFMAIGLTDGEENLAQNPVAVTGVLATILAPIMIILLHASLEDINKDTIRASESLGASRMRTFFRVILPQTSAALFSGVSLIFVLALNAYDTPKLIGGSRVPMISPAIYQAIMEQFDWPLGAVLTIGLLASALVALGIGAAVFKRFFSAWREAVL